MTAKIMHFPGGHGRPPSTANATAVTPVPARAPVTHLTPEEHGKMQDWAEERMRDAIRIYRSLHSSKELAMRLFLAAENELRLIEANHEPA
jgi:hypothetical protein